MANEGESSQPRSLSLEQAHEMSRDNAIIALQDQVRKLTMELERLKEFECRAPQRWEFDYNLVDIAYCSS